MQGNPGSYQPNSPIFFEFDDFLGFDAKQPKSVSVLLLPQLGDLGKVFLQGFTWYFYFQNAMAGPHKRILDRQSSNHDLQDDPVWIYDWTHMDSYFTWIFHLKALQHQSQFDNPSVAHDLPLLLLDLVFCLMKGWMSIPGTHRSSYSTVCWQRLLEHGVVETCQILSYNSHPR